MQQIPFLYTLIRGAIGKQFVIKHYGKRIVMTRFPDMTNIIPGKKQVACRQVFAAAVAYAKLINNNAELKKAYQATIKKGKPVYRAAIQEYLRLHKAACHDEQVNQENFLQLIKHVRKTISYPSIVTKPILWPFFIPVAHYNDTG